MRHVILALTLLLTLAHPAAAQHGSWTMPVFDGPAFRPAFSARDLKVMYRVLNLSPEAQQAVQTLYEGYAAQLRADIDKLKAASFEEMDRAELMNNDAMLEPVRERVAKFREHSDKMTQQFLSDLKSLLTREEEANWPTLERELRRIRKIVNGTLAGESLDVVGLAEDVLANEPMPAPLTEVLLRYRTAIDHALVERDAYLSGDGKDFMSTVSRDPQHAKAQWQKAIKLRLGVRDVNERFARQVAAELPEARRAEFERRVFQASYPMLHRPSRLDLYLEDALKLEDLTAEQRPQLEALRTSRKEKVAAWAREAAAGWRKFQEEEMPDQLRMALGVGQQPERAIMFNGSWLDEKHPLIQSRMKRVELDRAMKAQVDAVLTAEQSAAIPARLNDMAKFEVWTNHGI